MTLTAKPIVYVKGNGTWDKAFETITSVVQEVKAYVDKEGLKTDGLPMTIFTATDDTGFRLSRPRCRLPKRRRTRRTATFAVGQSPEGHALKFVHRGSYDDLDNTYEAITNYLDEQAARSQGHVHRRIRDRPAHRRPRSWSSTFMS